MAAAAGKIFFFFSFIICYVRSLELKQVVILGRHNLRTPLTDSLDKYTQKPWPKWKEDVAHLTEKGAVLEKYMGEYFSAWLEKHNLISGCPNNSSVFVYANKPIRTRDTAKYFTQAAFKNCDIPVHFTKDDDVVMDPVFHPVIHNTSEAFKKIVIDAMRRKIDELQLDDAYAVLNDVLELNKSDICEEKHFCDLTRLENDIVFEIGEEPNVYGPLGIGNSVTDAFLMYYYNGLPINEIGWGKIKPETLKLLAKITKHNQNVRFNSTEFTFDLAKPLLKELHRSFSKENVKFIMLVGHDSNLNSILSSLQFKPYQLPGQHETTPIGGKLVFQKWYDGKLNRNFLKVEYVYQSTEQLRDGDKLSLENPPYSFQMELKNCVKNDEGLCPWEEFLAMFELF